MLTSVIIPNVRHVGLSIKLSPETDRTCKTLRKYEILWLGVSRYRKDRQIVWEQGAENIIRITSSFLTAGTFGKYVTCGYLATSWEQCTCTNFRHFFRFPQNVCKCNPITNVCLPIKWKTCCCVPTTRLYLIS
jgi:hypothetical protein